jgi:antitoxin ParD1/3/4
MATLDLPLSDDLRRFVDERARQTHHSSPTDYVRALIREDQRKAAMARLEEKLIEGLDSGEAVEVTPAYLDDLERRIQEKIDARRAERGRNKADESRQAS